ncbi:hypothetical protein PPACK8108_LOCUS20662 [Phakopsora pachyrhizi]|uniref:UBX domain-containing protein n=1 Tax=Phakopsora pachyrhizi TaxID=170000 RepID=A0AAV0BHM4_PHAPC|nr:hypothetical protein PPACK8108_LOCUS20662 [Phakopsora pachyrhizi]
MPKSASMGPLTIINIISLISPQVRCLIGWRDMVEDTRTLTTKVDQITPAPTFEIDLKDSTAEAKSQMHKPPTYQKVKPDIRGHEVRIKIPETSEDERIASFDLKGLYNYLVDNQIVKIYFRHPTVNQIDRLQHSSFIGKCVKRLFLILPRLFRPSTSPTYLQKLPLVNSAVK